MIITQDNFIKQIADKENINAATVRDIFQSAESIIFDCFTSTAPSERIVFKLFPGVSLERTYVAPKEYSKGMFQNITCPERVRVKANLSKYYNHQVNNRLFPNIRR